MATKPLFNLSAATGKVEVSEKEATFLQMTSALTPGTIVVIPEQYVHKENRLVGAKSVSCECVFAYIYSSEFKLLEGKSLTVSQFTRRAFGLWNDLKDVEILPTFLDKGVRAEIPCAVTNRVGIDLPISAKGNKKIIPSAVAYRVERAQGYRIPILEQGQSADGETLYNYAVETVDDRTVIKPKLAMWPTLVTVPTDRMLTVLDESNLYCLK
jgi:hypothetical protein